MEYRGLLNRSWYLIWERKWLFLLGLLVILGGNSCISRGVGEYFNDHYYPELQQFDFQHGGNSNYRVLLEELADLKQESPSQHALIVAGLVIAVLVGLVIGLVLWALANIARGALIVGADTSAAGGAIDLRTAWQAGWARGWHMIGITLLMFVVQHVMTLIVLFVAGLIVALRTPGPGITVVPLKDMAVAVGIPSLLRMPVSWVFGVLQIFAYRACMLEKHDVLASYQRAWLVLKQHVRPAIVITLIVAGIGLAVAVVYGVVFVTGAFLGLLILCACACAPVVLFAQPVLTAFIETIWTLVWRVWTERPRLDQPGSEIPPVVSAAV